VDVSADADVAPQTQSASWAESSHEPDGPDADTHTALSPDDLVDYCEPHRDRSKKQVQYWWTGPWEIIEVSPSRSYRIRRVAMPNDRKNVSRRDRIVKRTSLRPTRMLDAGADDSTDSSRC